jgi:hypothetical protein
VNEDEVVNQQAGEEPASRWAVSTRVAVALVVVAIFAGIFAAKSMAPSPGGSGTLAAEESATSVRNDASADYVAALATGKPVYVLFHSLS